MTMGPARRAPLLLLASALAASPSATARAESQVWTALFAQGRLGRASGPTAWFDGHARRRGDGTLFLLRPGLGYTLSPALTAHVGYAYIPRLADEGANRYEHRLWQQVIWSQPVGAAARVQVRGRLEQRFGGGDEIGNRARVFLRGQWAPTARVPIQLVVWDEVFWQLDDTDWGPVAGFDQNRGFVGVGTDTRIDGVRVEAGYLNIAFRKDSQIDHAIAVNVFLTLAP